MEDYLQIYDEISKIKVVSSPAYIRDLPGDKKEVVRRLNAFDKNNNFLHGWDYVQFRTNPFYVSTHMQIQQSMLDLIGEAKSKIHRN